jgi:hypothetical protein
MTPFTRMLRIATGLVLVGAVVAAGFLRMAPRNVLWLGVAFTLSYVCGRFVAWQYVYRQRKLMAALGALPLTFLVQVLLVSVLYLLGLGLSTLFQLVPSPRNAFVNETLYAFYLGLFGVLSGLLISWLESRSDNDLARINQLFGSGTASDANLSVLGQQANVDRSNQSPRAELTLLPEPVTVQSFFRGIHYSHFSKQAADGVAKHAPNAQSAGDPQKIADMQSRLAIVLPAKLASIYLHQNGGSINSICVPKAGAEEPKYFDDVITPFSGYDDLYPLEVIDSLHEAISNYADPELQPEEFPEGCERMFVLARWYQETLFLDYRDRTEPRVGFVNFEDLDDWQDRCVWWESFDEFFDQCRHFETL